jgi:hypothetical protein
MSRKKQAPKNKQQASNKKQQDSVFKEAWENMSEDMARVMPAFLVKGLQGGKRKAWVMVAITFVELVVLGVVGKFAYDWFTK